MVTIVQLESDKKIHFMGCYVSENWGHLCKYGEILKYTLRKEGYTKEQIVVGLASGGICVHEDIPWENGPFLRTFCNLVVHKEKQEAVVVLPKSIKSIDQITNEFLLKNMPDGLNAYSIVNDVPLNPPYERCFDKDMWIGIFNRNNNTFRNQIEEVLKT